MYRQKNLVHVTYLIFAFSPSKTAISFNILFLRILFLRYKLLLHTYTINVVSFYYLWYGAVYKRQYTDKTLTLGESMYTVSHKDGIILFSTISWDISCCRRYLGCLAYLPLQC